MAQRHLDKKYKSRNPATGMNHLFGHSAEPAYDERTTNSGTVQGCDSLRRMRHRYRISTVLGLLLTALITGCTSASTPRPVPPTSSPPPGAQVIHLQGDDTLKFTPANVTVRTGMVQLVFTVTGHTPHTFTAPTLNADSGNVLPGHSVTIQLNIPRPGDYPFYCAYHKTQGMTGTITATA